MTQRPTFEIECVVAGAGVIGLAVARALARSGKDVLIIEKAGAFGTETSARNSEVIHAGIYYPQGSLKARSCVRGKHLLYAYLSERGLPHKRLGKLIVATNAEQVGDLTSIGKRAESNGVDDLRVLSKAQTHALEPDLAVEAALHSPSTGILDSHAYMLSLLGEAEDHGASLVLDTEIERGEVLSDGRLALECHGTDPCRLIATNFINCAGLFAPLVAKRISGLKETAVPEAHFAKGNYFTLAGRAPFSKLVYPVPEPGGLGVHLTLDLGGQARFGPDVEWVSELDYSVAPDRAVRFYDAIRSYWPGLRDGDLQPDYSGIRPKIVGPGEPAADFVIAGPDTIGAPGQVHLFGIESPGLTASLALAEDVCATLKSSS